MQPKLVCTCLCLWGGSDIQLLSIALTAQAVLGVEWGGAGVGGGGWAYLPVSVPTATTDPEG